ncbi:unnamed protein product [Symbiodinium natans]|uniref:C3H1-type domain-containing protein n=1 Tax=Symbiodinium natans TaxID=878477 RepID=A0A812PHS4_9DINO|nr:unnamed protein product [Symbiodinium natans]
MAVRKGIVSVAGQEVKVKNGFLDDLLEDSSPESTQVVIERSTCPVFTRKEGSFQTSFGDAPLPELFEPMQAPWPSEMTTMDSFSGNGHGCDRLSWSSMASGYEPDMPLKVISRDVPAQAPPPMLTPPVRRASPAALLPAPSVGSQRHGRPETTCTPCPFFWQPSGCVEGRSCLFCHLCPDPTIKQKKHPKKTVQGDEPTVTFTGEAPMTHIPIPEATKVPIVEGYAQYIGAAQPPGASTTPEQHQKVLEMQQKLCPSIFEDHAAGQCKPCTFFWKPEGCRKSEACHHCHLCPPSALKDRKIQKVMARRQEKASKGTPKTPEAPPATGAPVPAGLVYL